MDILSARIIVTPRDLGASLHFYRDQLGLAVYREFGEDNGRGVVFFAGGAHIEVSGEDNAASCESQQALWLQVRDIGEARDELAGKGVIIVREPQREPWGLDEMHIADPDGLKIFVVEVPPDHPMRRR